jgi:hypothetical protein
MKSLSSASKRTVALIGWPHLRTRGINTERLACRRL